MNKYWNVENILIVSCVFAAGALLFLLFGKKRDNK